MIVQKKKLKYLPKNSLTLLKTQNENNHQLYSLMIEYNDFITTVEQNSERGRRINNKSKVYVEITQNERKVLKYSWYEKNKYFQTSPCQYHY